MTALAQGIHNDFAGDFAAFDGVLSRAQRLAIQGGKPYLADMFAGTAIERAVGSKIDDIILNNPDHPLASVDWTSISNKPYDFELDGGVRVDLTGGSRSSIFGHQSRSAVDFVISYDSLPSGFGSDYMRWLHAGNGGG